MTKGLVISFRMCRDKIGWLYEYNNQKWLKNGWRCGQSGGFLVIPFNELWWLGYIYTTNTYSSSVLGINKWLCIYDKPLFITNQLTIFMVIEWSYRRYNQIFDQQSCCGGADARNTHQNANHKL